ncbi:cupin domain-containing protein [Oceanobacillus saliphilus]|uniref:cupin domain-containing protein n=1 Tax=Oceanobacillus saliphilus TaxID=2925834 RepID=UPI00201D3538|nr:cupin domain-containing protein [Oceanobacillus saliphilus]
MSNSKVDQRRLGITKRDELIVETTQDLNITWNAGVKGEKIWMGSIVAEPGAESAALHHNESDTAHYVLKGKALLLYGGNFEVSVEVNEGDFIHIPPYHPYIYKNLSSNETLEFVTFMVPSIQVVYVDTDEKVEIPQSTEGDQGISIVKASELDDSTNQTRNMPRRTGIQSTNFWIGRVTGHPAMDSGAHTHGIAETGGFIISGKTRILFGDDYEEYEEFGPGDFVRVPPFLPHIERNESDTNTVEFVTARNPGNIVINLDD